ncbi:hypothetical protein PF010_g9009 [Phytophthora fragariae]|uniref:Uncharacterized protein n=1 Tax=Phytophthora fragariae TaxID=53985 RepID=A0A6A3L5T5_9STRA|nr:hypothetical protein PF011_g8516 [Phytophthora fragariae]KAE9116323.1 hypothetical protein PF010_g9009 [Phytophthora fragariae]
MPTKLPFASALASRVQPSASAQCIVLSSFHASAHVQYPDIAFWPRSSVEPVVSLAAARDTPPTAHDSSSTRSGCDRPGRAVTDQLPRAKTGAFA